jgi:hypothetical protein
LYTIWIQFPIIIITDRPCHILNEKSIVECTIWHGDIADGDRTDIATDIVTRVVYGEIIVHKAHFQIRYNRHRRVSTIR